MSIDSVGLITKMHTSNELKCQSFKLGGVIPLALQIALRMTSDFLVYRSNHLLSRNASTRPTFPPVYGRVQPAHPQSANG